jgi:hypothetical protein
MGQPEYDLDTPTQVSRSSKFDTMASDKLLDIAGCSQSNKPWAGHFRLRQQIERRFRSALDKMQTEPE